MTAQLLNLNIEPTSDGATESDLSEELKRRSFWSCWAAECISQGNASFKGRPWQEVVGLPLPSDEESFLSGKPISVECYDENGGIESLGTTDLTPGPSPMGELVKLFGLWY